MVLWCVSIGIEPIKKDDIFPDGTQVYTSILANVKRALFTTNADVIRQSQILQSQQTAHACLHLCVCMFLELFLNTLNFCTASIGSGL